MLTIQDIPLIELMWFYLPKVLVATVCGIIIGYERHKKGKAAGLKTNMIICVGATLFSATSILLYQLAGGPDSEGDINRVIAQIVSGIGFLGAGAIFKSCDKVVGLTTASMIWFLGAIGTVVGCGGYYIAMIMTLGFLIVTLIAEMVERKIENGGNDA